MKGLLLLGVLLGAIACTRAQTVPCDLRQEKYGGVCVCTDDYCDYLEDVTPENEMEFSLVSSSMAGLRFDTKKGNFNLFMKFNILDYDQRNPLNTLNTTEDDPPSEMNNARASSTRTVRLDVNREKQFQKVVGFGGSFTGAVAHNLDLLTQPLQDHVYKSFYSAKGIGFNLLRTPIGGCDFDVAPWAYNEEPENDPELTNFSKLDPRDQSKVGKIKRLMEVSNIDKLRIKGAAWSSPKWMKSNNKWTGFSHLKKEYYQTWANYHLKWLELMEENGLPIWAISTGNEPLNGVAFMVFVKFMSLGWTPQNQAIWLSDNLGPTIRNSKYKDLIIFGNDDQRYTYPLWFDIMKRVRPDSWSYINGLATHWYWDEMVSPIFMDKAIAKMPDKIVLTTESCIGDKPWHKAAPLLGSWKRGEKYARAFLQDLQHGYHGWIDWNLILDEQGGPSYVDNFVDAPVIVDKSNTKEVLKQPMFYTIGHFSKFIPEGSVRIDSVRSNVNIDTIAYLRPDNTISIVILNSGNAKVEVNLMDSVRGALVLNVPPRSIHTLIYK